VNRSDPEGVVSAPALHRTGFGIEACAASALGRPKPPSFRHRLFRALAEHRVLL
jgi:hypothetical protein